MLKDVNSIDVSWGNGLISFGNAIPLSIAPMKEQSVSAGQKASEDAFEL